MLAISVGAISAALVVGGALGLLAAYRRGWTDRIVMRLMDVLFAFPVLLLAIGVIAVLGPRSSSAAIAIAVVYTPIFMRVVRGPVLALKQRDFVEAARAVGATPTRIVARHIVHAGVSPPRQSVRQFITVQLTVAETLGVEGRGGYFESAGILRDMIQNHMFQLLALVAMEPPSSFEAIPVRDEKVKVLNAIRPMQPEEILQRTVRGQYGEGFVDG